MGRPSSKRLLRTRFHAAIVRGRDVRVALDTHGRERCARAPDHAATIPPAVNRSQYILGVDAVVRYFFVTDDHNSPARDKQNMPMLNTAKPTLARRPPARQDPQP